MPDSPSAPWTWTGGGSVVLWILGGFLFAILASVGWQIGLKLWEAL